MPNGTVWSHNTPYPITFKDSLTLLKFDPNSNTLKKLSAIDSINGAYRKLPRNLKKISFISWIQKKKYKVSDTLKVFFEVNNTEVSLHDYLHSLKVDPFKQLGVEYRMEINNGDEWSGTEYKFRINKKGVYQIPSIEINIDKKKLITKPIVFEVEK